jgi:hypothetical protein
VTVATVHKDIAAVVVTVRVRTGAARHRTLTGRAMWLEDGREGTVNYFT